MNKTIILLGATFFVAMGGIFVSQSFAMERQGDGRAQERRRYGLESRRRPMMENGSLIRERRERGNLTKFGGEHPW